jgi:uncharacterized protein (DUF362 family)
MRPEVPMPVDRERRRVLRALLGLPLVGGVPALAGGAPGESAQIPGPRPSPRPAPGRAVVARGRRDGLLGAKGALDGDKLDELLGAALARAVGEDGPVDAMRRLFRPSDVVGLKLNTLSGRGLSPDPLLVGRLCDWLQQAGVPAKNIVVWDRTDRELAAAGFTIVRAGSGVRCLGTNDDYDWQPREWGPGASCFAKILVRDVTALINVGVLKDHDLAGVSIGLKNWYGVIHNPNKHHDEGCAPYVPHLANYPLIRDKVRLTVVDATVAQYHAGPARNPKWRWPWQGVLVSTDPVALDAVGWRMIEDRRKEGGLPALAEEKRAPRFIAEAARLGLGEADPARIRVEDV